MISKVRTWIRLNLPGLYQQLIYLRHRFFYNNFYKKSYAQFGEDLICSHLFSPDYKGFFVDIGAHRPTQESNTFYFYKKGWRGINVDAMPGSMRLFKGVRPGDINLEMGVSEKKQVLNYFIFDQPLINGFYSQEEVDTSKKFKNANLIAKKEIETKPLYEILDLNLPKNTEIDLMSIDVEGLDFEVLKSNDWTKYFPKVILIEILGFDIESLEEYPIYQFLKEKGYIFYSRTMQTLIFKLKTHERV